MGSDELPGFSIGTQCNIYKNPAAFKASANVF
jgi:hypothetical protein